MTLRRQLFISLTLLFVALLAASMTVNLFNARRHLEKQMAVQARDAASSAAFAISTAIANGKAADIAPTLEAMFTGDYYSVIAYRDLQGQDNVEKRLPVQTSPVPDWFNRLLPITAPTAQADVLSGWSQLGSVSVTINTAFAYRDLWGSFCEQLALFGVACALTYGLSSMALNILLKPLQRVEEQAAAMCERHFIEQQPLPKTRELRSMVEAINRTSRKLKVIFQEQLALTESLRAQSHLDPVTGLSNRREFNARLQAVTDSESGNGGCLMILQISHFGRYNLRHGHEAGDECLRAVAAHLQSLTAETPDAIISRRAGADFAVYLPRISQERAREIAAQLLARIASLDLLFDHTIHIGLACCEVLRADHRLLSEADIALRQAQARSHSDWQLYQEGDIVQVAREARQWFATLNRVLQDHQLTFHYQPLFMRDDQDAFAAETFCRITMQDKLVKAGIFLPMAERFGLSEAFDRLIISEVRQRSDASQYHLPLFINLSPQSVCSSGFVDWLSGYLAEYPDFARRLVVETSEYLVRTGNEQVRELCHALHRHGARLSLDHYGIHSAAFGYLHSVPLDFLKVDRSFIRDIQLNTDNQFYVQALVQIAHSRDITILAEGVETAEEWACLLGLGIDGGQGYFLSRPDSHINTRRS